MAYNMAAFLGDAETGWQWGLTAGFLTGFGWAAAIFTVIALFEQKSWRLYSHQWFSILSSTLPPSGLSWGFGDSRSDK